MWLRVSLRHPIGFLDQVVARYRVHGDNASHDALRMTQADLVVIDSVVKGEPLARERAGRTLVRRRLMQLHRELGEWQMWKMRDFAAARRHFAAALANAPLSPALWRKLIWCALPASQRTTLSWWGVKLRSRLRSGGAAARGHRDNGTDMNH
jgi:hypothetical protein